MDEEEEEEWGRFFPSWWTKQNISTPLLSRGTRKYVQTENLRISALKLNEKRNEQINGIRKLVRDVTKVVVSRCGGGGRGVAEAWQEAKKRNNSIGYEVYKNCAKSIF